MKSVLWKQLLNPTSWQLGINKHLKISGKEYYQRTVCTICERKNGFFLKRHLKIYLIVIIARLLCCFTFEIKSEEIYWLSNQSLFCSKISALILTQSNWTECGSVFITEVSIEATFSTLNWNLLKRIVRNQPNMNFRTPYFRPGGIHRYLKIFYSTFFMSVLSQAWTGYGPVIANLFPSNLEQSHLSIKACPESWYLLWFSTNLGTPSQSSLLDASHAPVLPNVDQADSESCP